MCFSADKIPFSFRMLPCRWLMLMMAFTNAKTSTTRSGHDIVLYSQQCIRHSATWENLSFFAVVVSPNLGKCSFLIKKKSPARSMSLLHLERLSELHLKLFWASRLLAIVFVTNFFRLFGRVRMSKISAFASSSTKMRVLTTINLGGVRDKVGSNGIALAVP